MPARIACIGSRELSWEELSVCKRLGRVISLNGGEIHSGNAPGADQAFAQGGNEVNPESVHLHLPWPSFEKDKIVRGNHVHLLESHPAGEEKLRSVAARFHPVWPRLSQGARKLHTRNVSILFPGIRERVDLVLAWPSNRPGGGGTGQGLRIAEGYGIPIEDLHHAYGETPRTVLTQFESAVHKILENRIEALCTSTR